MLSPILDKYTGDPSNIDGKEVDLVTVDVDAHQELAAKYKVSPGYSYPVALENIQLSVIHPGYRSTDCYGIQKWQTCRFIYRAPKSQWCKAVH